MKAFIIILSFLIASQVLSQSPRQVMITGIVKDSATGAMLDYATITLYGMSNQVTAAGITRQGEFKLKVSKPGNYVLSISHVGYGTLRAKVVIKDTDINLGAFALKTSGTKLNDVTVTAEKPLVRQEPDRLTYDLQADPESKGNNVLEMMRKVPLLAVDASDNVLLQGNANYKIFINGKPSSLMDRNAKDVLRTMPASTIQRIEVITTPPAKYDGEGLAGIINIVTIKKGLEGYNGTVNVSERFPAGGPGLGSVFTAKAGKWGIAVFGGASQNKMPRATQRLARTAIITGGKTELVQDGGQTADGHSEVVNSEISFEADSLNLITAQINWSGNNTSSQLDQRSTLTGSSGPLQGYLLGTKRVSTGNSLDAALNYQMAFRKNKNNTLTFSYRYLGFDNYQNATIDINDRVNFSQPGYRQYNGFGLDEHTFQVDFTGNLGKIVMESGIKGILRRNNSAFSVDTLGSILDQYFIDFSRSNEFIIRQDVWSLYNAYQFNLGKWNIKAGARIEQTIVEGISTAAIHQRYLNAIPSFAASHRFNSQSSISIGVTSRIQRPGIAQMNPFVDRTNPNVEITGNPDLAPTSGTSVDLNYALTKKFSLVLSGRAQWMRDIIMSQVILIPGTNLSRSMFANIGKARLAFLVANLNYPLSKTIRATVTGNIAHIEIQGEINGQPARNEGIMGRIFTGLGYRGKGGLQVNANVNVSSNSFSLQGSINGFVGTSFSASKDLVASKLSLTVVANNVFSKFRNAETTVAGPAFSQVSLSQSYLRNFSLNLIYKFGKLKSDIKKNKKGIVNNDTTEGNTL